MLESAPTIGGGTRTAELHAPRLSPRRLLRRAPARHPVAIPVAPSRWPTTGSPGSSHRPRSPTRSTASRRSSCASRSTPLLTSLRPDAARVPAADRPAASPPARRSSPRSSVPHISPATRCCSLGFGVPALLPATVLGRTVVSRRARSRLCSPAARPTRSCRSPGRSARPSASSSCSPAHVETWPIAQGGSAAITSALAGYLVSLGGRIETGTDGWCARRPPSVTRRALRHEPRSGRNHRVTGAVPRVRASGSVASATGRASSRSTGHSTAPSPGPIRHASNRRPCMSAARSTRSRPRRQPSGTIESPTGRT